MQFSAIVNRFIVKTELKTSAFTNDLKRKEIFRKMFIVGDLVSLRVNQKLVIKTDYGLMQIKSIAECSKGSRFYCTYMPAERSV